MIDALVMTLGFEPGPLISAVATAASEGLNDGARIIVLTAAFPDERSERAWLELQRIVGMMDLPKKLGVELALYEIPLNDLSEAALKIKQEVLDGIRNKRVKISITGGMRALGIAVIIACVLTQWVVEPVLEVYLEGRGTALRIPSLRKLILASERCRSIVEVLREGPLRLDELANRLKRDRSTVYRKLKLLVDAGAVRRSSRGYELTALGRLLL